MRYLKGGQHTVVVRQVTVNEGCRLSLEASTGAGGGVTKPDINPMHLAPRCCAHSKRTGLSCRSPAVRGWRVCRMHGARGGAPSGHLNGNYRHGSRTICAKIERKGIRALSDHAAFLIKQMEMREAVPTTTGSARRKGR